MENAPVPKGEIRVELADKKDGRLAFRLSFAGGLDKYFNTSAFFVKYDRDIEDVSESILYIPIVANIAPVAWATGANIRVRELDGTFIESLQTIKSVMGRMYPDFSRAGGICVENAVSNRFAHSGASQLFTGGVDSLATYAGHREEKPGLISFKTYTQFSVPLQRLIDGELSRFAQKEGLRLHMVESNILFLLNDARLVSDYGRYLPEASWWASVQHGMGLLGLCAPLTAVTDIKRVYIGSTTTGKMILDPWAPWGSHQYIDDNVSWADVNAHHDGYDMTRQDKIRLIKQYVEKSGAHPPLIVCNDPDRGVRYNCSACEKCYRTMVGLALEGMDPNAYGFRMGDETLDEVRQKLLDKELKLVRKQPYMWKDIQRCIPDTIRQDMYGSRRFFRWLKKARIMDDGSTRAPIMDSLAAGIKAIPARLRTHGKRLF